MTPWRVTGPAVGRAAKKRLEEVYTRLLDCYGPQYWWPGEEPFEVMVGAVLTQSVAWKTVETAITALKNAGALSPAVLRDMELEEIAGLIRPTVYYNVKARKLKALVEWFLESCNGDIAVMRKKERDALRNELLAIWGIGEETADSIVLYAAEKPSFVIDAYTRRIIDRIGLKPGGDRYADYRALFTRSLPSDTAMYNEYHALLVRHGKDVCRPKPLCDGCFIRDVCRTGIKTG
jgi:endonuclease-3 related protein